MLVLTKEEIAKVFSMYLNSKVRYTSMANSKILTMGWCSSLFDVEGYKKHKIKVYKTSVTSSGHAFYKTRKIKVPVPTNLDRFAVCLHEIKHIIDGNGKSRFEEEFKCDMFARNILIELGYSTTDWDRRTRWHVLSRIAMAHNRGLNHSKINSEIRTFFNEIDFTKWIGNKVFVGSKYSKSNNPDDIEFTPSMSKSEIEVRLNRKGLMLDKSQRDDSTYNKWIVSSNGDSFGQDFDNLSEIVLFYHLVD